MELSADQLRQFALIGAQEELKRIYSAFPELRAAMLEESKTPQVVEAPAASNGKKRGMSPEMRERVSKRMKSYWKKRRAAKTKH